MLCAGFALLERVKNFTRTPCGKETKLLQSCKSTAVYSTSSVLFTYLAYQTKDGLKFVAVLVDSLVQHSAMS